MSLDDDAPASSQTLPEIAVLQAPTSSFPSSDRQLDELESDQTSKLRPKKTKRRSNLKDNYQFEGDHIPRRQHKKSKAKKRSSEHNDDEPEPEPDLASKPPYKKRKWRKQRRPDHTDELDHDHTSNQQQRKSKADKRPSDQSEGLESDQGSTQQRKKTKVDQHLSRLVREATSGLRKSFKSKKTKYGRSGHHARPTASGSRSKLVSVPRSQDVEENSTLDDCELLVE